MQNKQTSQKSVCCENVMRQLFQDRYRLDETPHRKWVRSPDGCTKYKTVKSENAPDGFCNKKEESCSRNDPSGAFSDSVGFVTYGGLEIAGPIRTEAQRLVM